MCKPLQKAYFRSRCLQMRWQTKEDVFETKFSSFVQFAIRTVKRPQSKKTLLYINLEQTNEFSVESLLSDKTDVAVSISPVAH